MHDCIYREFDITSLPAQREAETGAAGQTLCVTMTHKPSGVSKGFQFTGTTCGHDRLIEAQVVHLFPESAAARQLRRLAGHTLAELAVNWDSGLAKTMQFGLLSLCDTKGAAFWWNQLQSLPRVVRFMLFKRTGQKLAGLTGAHPLREFADAAKQAWAEVLTEACGLDGWRDVKLTELHHKGWPVTALEQMSPAELVVVSEQARLAFLALDFLEEHDWFGMLGFLLEDTPEEATCLN